MRIQQRGQRTQDARLRLSTQSKQDKVVARKYGVDDLRNDGVLISDDAGEDGLLRAKATDKIFAKLVLDAASQAFGGVVTAPESAEGRRKHIGHDASIDVCRGPKVRPRAISGIGRPATPASLRLHGRCRCDRQWRFPGAIAQWPRPICPTS